MKDLLLTTRQGLYCPQGDFYIDPWEPCGRAVITHAHADHARAGSARYLAARCGVPVLARRLGPDAVIEPLEYGESITLGGVRLSLHPAGHVLGSSQVRLEHQGQVSVVTGDYKTAADPTCQPFELLRCHTLVTESTFGLPIYRWRPGEEILQRINDWWRANRGLGRTSLIYAYSLGKAQRILAGLDPSIGPILVHGAVDNVNAAYHQAGVRLPAALRATTEAAAASRGQAIVIAPPWAASSPWTRKFGPAATAIASGWMQIRGTRRRRAVDRGFALSDHADWEALNGVIQASQAEQVWVTHGYTSVVVRWLTEQGFSAKALATQFEGEPDESTAPPDHAEPPL